MRGLKVSAYGGRGAEDHAEPLRHPTLPTPTPDPPQRLLPFAKRFTPLIRLTNNMNFKTAFQTASLIVAGIILALVANAFASRDRKMALAGSYPNALKVPAREITQPAPA